MGIKYNKLDLEEGMELKDLKERENDVLLDSFDHPLHNDDSFESSSTDRRLNSDGSDLEPTPSVTATETHMHEGRHTGTGSSSDGIATTQQQRQQQEQEEAEEAENVDLESQTPIIALTRTQRIFKALHQLMPVKQTYDRLSNGLTTGRMQSNVPGRFIGQGTDGVFRNLMAKPDADSQGVKNETVPPTYEEAAADATPEYWSSVIAPVYEDEVFVEGLPVGNIANFVWNGLVAIAFQFVGFLLCYLLHTSHAAKHGSRAGLGVTFIFYGWNLVPSNFGSSNELPEKYEPKNPNDFDIDKTTTIEDSGVDDYISDLFQPDAEEAVTNTPYLAYGLIAFGLLMIGKAIVDYYRVKSMETAILHPPNSENEEYTEPSSSTEASTEAN